MTQGSSGRSDWGAPARPELAALLLILIGALALRLWGIGSFAFWEDELYTVDETADLFRSRYEDGIFARPLYFLLMNLLSPVLPQSPWGLRMPALAFGMASIGLAWLVARTIAGPWAAVVSAVAISLAPGHLFISTVNRYWSMVFLAGLVFSWLAIRALQSDHPRAYREALVVLLMGAAANPLFLAAVAAVGVGSCVDVAASRLGLRWPSPNALRSLWIPGLVVLLLAYGAIAWTQGARQVTQVGAAVIDPVQRARIVPAIAFALTPVVSFGCVLGALRLRLSQHPAARHWAAATLFGAPVSLAALLSLSGVTQVTWIYASALTPLFFVAFGGLCAQTAGEPWPGTFGPVLLVLGAGVMLPSTISHLADGGRFDFRPAFDAIRRSDPSLPVVLNPLVQARREAPDLQSVELPADGSVEGLEALRRAKKRFWLLLCERRHGITYDPKGLRLAFANTCCRPWGEYGRVRLDYEMYRVRLYLCDC